jgi:parallel beta-helix repeat protein
MLNKPITTVLILLLTMSILSVINTNILPQILPVKAANITRPSSGIMVNMTGYWPNISDTFITNSTPIQAAIDYANATTGWNITVTAGTYTGNVNVGKPLTLQGESSATVTVNAANPSISVFKVTANSVNISGFTVIGATGGGQGGIFLDAGVALCNISNNNLRGSFDGIWLGAGSNHNTLTGNTLSSNTAQGFEIYHSDYNTFTNNNASSNSNYGFKMETASHNTFTDNTANSNGRYGFYLVKGPITGTPPGCLNNTFTNNTANLNTQYGFREDYGDHNTWTGNTFNSNVVAGIRLKENITNLMLDDNSISGSPIGIDIATVITNVTSWTVTHNNIAGNTVFGVSNNGTGALNATLNWWGNATGPYHSTTNPSGTGCAVSDYVDYVPWLIKPYPPAVLIPKLRVDSVTIESPVYGKNFTTDVKLANVTDLYGFEFKLYWNTTLLDLVEANVTPPWTNYANGTDQINETIGRYYVGLSALAQSPSFNGSTTLVTLTFKITCVPVYPENVSCLFDLNETILADPDGNPIPHVVYDGEYRCYATKAKIQVLPQVSEAKALNQVFNISITVTNVANLQTFEFTIQYNTTLLDAKEITIASFPGRTYKVSKKIIDDTQGLVTLRIESINPPLQANESLVLASITFQVTYAVIWLKPAIESYLRFNSTKLITDAAADVPHDKTDGLYRYRPIQGDMDSDGKVTIIDLAIVARAYGTKPGDPKWNELADLNHDNIINILDLIPVARNYGRTD